MKKVNHYFIIISIWLLATVAHAESAADLFLQKFQAIRTMEASFTQVIKTKTRQLSQASGKMAVFRPGRFRWETTKPMAQLVIANGTRFWVYDPDLEQVTVRRQTSAMQSSAVLFLSDHDLHLLESFDISVKNHGNFSDFDLRSKSSRADFKHVIFEFEGKILRGMELFDALGQRTVVRFEHIKINQPLAAQVFEFKPPKGVDIIEEGDERG